MTTSYYEYHDHVQYADLGEDSRLSPTGILRMMQEAACEDSSQRGFSPYDTVRDGFGWVLCGWKLKIIRRPGWGAKLTVRTWPRAMAVHTSDRDFLILDEAGDTLVAATSRWLLLNTVTGRVDRITEAVSSRYPLWPHRALEEDLPAGGKSSPDAVCTYRYTVLHRDIDTLHHMNNLRYLELAREALPAQVQRQDFANIEILYKRQIKLGEQANFLYSFQDGRHLVEIVDGAGKKSHALVWFF